MNDNCDSADQNGNVSNEPPRACEEFRPVRSDRMTESVFNYHWKISNFNSVAKAPQVTESPVFTAGFEDEFKWRVRLDFVKEDGIFDYLHPNVPEFREYSISLYLGPFSYHEASVQVKYTFDIWRCESGDFLRKTYMEGEVIELEEGYYLGLSRFAKLNELKKPIYRRRADQLDISVHGSIVQNVLETGLPRSTLVPDVIPLLENPEFGDVTLSAGDKKLFAHRAILSARSSVFAAMFNGKMEDRVITDMDYKVLKELLVYIYTSTSPNVETLAAGLIVAADKYDLGRLKLICVNALICMLNVENAVQSLILADRLCLKRLLNIVLKFMSTNMRVILHSSAWKDLIATHPHLINKVVETLT